MRRDDYFVISIIMLVIAVLLSIALLIKTESTLSLMFFLISILAIGAVMGAQICYDIIKSERTVRT